MSAVMSPMSIKLDSAVRGRLNSIAIRHKRTAHAVAREAIEAYVMREEATEAQNREALAAWNHYQETGLHVTAQEVTAWVESWGTNDEAAPPECHV